MCNIQSVAIVTGASRGIGAAVAKRLAKDGFSVVVNYANNEKEAQNVVDEIKNLGGQAIAIKADVSKAIDVAQLFDSTESTLGSPDVLVNSAGIMELSPLAQCSDDIFEKMVSVNFKGTFNTLREAAIKTERGLFVGSIDAKLMDCIVRLMRLLDSPKDIPYLRPLIFQEIYYRLLSGPHGASIIQACLLSNNMQRIAKIINIIKSNIDRSINIDELAAMVNMSTSSFYSQFKQVTGFSPLQYLKRLRLTEARQIMLSENKDATSTAYLVGYESPSQFSREYVRFFGSPPQRDVSEFRKLIIG